MKTVVQRVVDASVTVDGVLKGQIKFGLLVYLGVAREDTEADAIWLAEKIANLRIFNDADGVMNLSLKDIINQEAAGNAAIAKSVGVLAVSQFTLLGDARKGRRPSWGRAAPPEMARRLYDYFVDEVRKQGLICECGEFQAYMKINYTNDGPVTVLLDSKE